MTVPAEPSGAPTGLLRPDRRPSRPLSRLVAPEQPGTAALVTRRDDQGARSDLGGPDPLVGGLTLDSRWVQPGDVYVALPGLRTHGARFTAAATRQGAIAVLTDPAGLALIEQVGDHTDEALPVLVADDPRAVMGELAARLYDRPADTLTMIGITGTNGKTTTAFLVESALRRLGRRVGVIGTLGFRLDGADLGGARTTVTTPESVDLHALLALLRDRGADCVVMEVSSHALALQRVAGIRFDVAAFTNLGRDHLDFHRHMEDYFAAKASLFRPERTRAAVINTDDDYGRRLLAQLDAAVPVATTSSRSDPAGTADWQVQQVTPDRAGSQVDVRTPTSRVSFRLGLPGDYNVHNAITALALVAAVGGDPQEAAAGLAEAAVPGRMQPVDLGSDAPAVVVDFAHTPQAVTAALTALSALDADRLVVVLGCGGDRDRAKRGPMGAAAAAGADVVVVTDDNPRSEDPTSIRAEVLAGARSAEQPRAATIIDGGDRRSAIRIALIEAGRPSDAHATDRRSTGRPSVVAILGKGHEHGQELTGSDGTAVTVPFDDVAVAEQEWRRLQPDQPDQPAAATAGRS